MLLLCDNARHFICYPYSLTNLHLAAKSVKIKPCWFHKDHYDIPKRRVKEIQAKCRVVSPKVILKVIKNGKKENRV